VGLDVLRGTGIMGVVLLHASLYHYANLLSLDFDNPPPVVIVIGLLLMWAGLFAVVSGAVHAVQTVRRLGGGESPGSVMRGQLVNGGLILACAYVYFLFLGPALLDRVNGDHDYSVLMGVLVKGHLGWPSIERVLYVDTLVMIGLNIVLGALVIRFLVGRAIAEKPQRAAVAMLFLGSVLVLASYVRIWTFPVVDAAIERGDVLGALPLVYLFNKNNPILPFFGFALFGMALGVLLAKCPWREWAGKLALFAAAWMAAGVVGYLMLPDTMLEREIDPMWFTIIVAQVGLFTLLALGAVRFFDVCAPAVSARRARRFHTVERFGVAGLSVFMLETPVSELLAKALSAVMPGWNDTMTGALVFGAALVVLWGIALKAWERTGYAYGVEWLLVRAQLAAGKASTKLSPVETLPVSEPASP